MSKGVKIGNVIKHSISFSPEVNQWAQDLAKNNGFGTNFSAFFADLIRKSKREEDRERVPDVKDQRAALNEANSSNELRDEAAKVLHAESDKPKPIVETPKPVGGHASKGVRSPSSLPAKKPSAGASRRRHRQNPPHSDPATHNEKPDSK